MLDEVARLAPYRLGGSSALHLRIDREPQTPYRT